MGTHGDRQLDHAADGKQTGSAGNVSRNTPTIALDLRVVPPESLEMERRPLTISATPAAATEASLWIGPHVDFPSELASLSEFANAQFAKSDFVIPRVSADSVDAGENPEAHPTRDESYRQQSKL